MDSTIVPNAKKLMKSVVKKEPNLTPNGFYVCASKLGYEANYSPDEMFTEDILRQFSDAYAWLETIEKRKTINLSHTSYGYKHIAEDWAQRYICNGALIAAAIALKIPYKRADANSPNAFLALSERSIKEARREAKEAQELAVEKEQEND